MIGYVLFQPLPVECSLFEQLGMFCAALNHSFNLFDLALVS